MSSAFYIKKPSPVDNKEARVTRKYPFDGHLVMDLQDPNLNTYLVWPAIVQYEHIETKQLMSFPVYLPWRLVVRDNYKYFHLFSHGWLTCPLHTGLYGTAFINNWHRSQHLHYLLSQQDQFTSFKRQEALNSITTTP